MTPSFSTVHVVTFTQERSDSIIRANKSQILRSYCYKECLVDRIQRRPPLQTRSLLVCCWDYQ